ncbi:MAG: SGNH/GDSL hydrolase family protein [Marmoricola sp.]
MLRLPRAVRRPTTLLALLGSTVVLAAATMAPAAADSGGAVYVNMGDSYSAGSGVLPLAAGTDIRCAQSSRNWAHDIAAAEGYRLTDVSCGGADTSDYFTPQYSGVPPQLDALSPHTDLVTMSIGGNDNGTFSTALEDCGSLGLESLGYGSPCKDKYGDSFANTVRTSTYDNLVKAFTAVRQAAPNARIVAANYLWILPATQGCFPFMPVARGDVPYLRSLQQVLSETIEKAAAQTGVTYLDFSGVSEGHDACQSIGTRWVEPAFGSTQFVPVHPNALGERHMADYAASQLGLG